MKTENITSAKILRHIADLHEAGVVADKDETYQIYKQWDNHYTLIVGAEFYIASTSEEVFDKVSQSDLDWNAAIAKNQRRLDWMRDNPDPTKTPVELWEAAKIALKEVENEHE